MDRKKQIFLTVVRMKMKTALIEFAAWKLHYIICLLFFSLLLSVFVVSFYCFLVFGIFKFKFHLPKYTCNCDQMHIESHHTATDLILWIEVLLYLDWVISIQNKIIMKLAYLVTEPKWRFQLKFVAFRKPFFLDFWWNSDSKYIGSKIQLNK